MYYEDYACTVLFTTHHLLVTQTNSQKHDLRFQVLWAEES